jgi:hypothetical protein
MEIWRCTKCTKHPVVYVKYTSIYMQHLYVSKNIVYLANYLKIVDKFLECYVVDHLPLLLENIRLILRKQLVTRVKHRDMSSPWERDSRPRDPPTDLSRIAQGLYPLDMLARTLRLRIRRNLRMPLASAQASADRRPPTPNRQ